MNEAEKTELQKRLQCDPISRAEKVTGRSYKDDKLTLLLGVGEMFSNNKRKQELLKTNFDTYYCMLIGECLAVIEDLGFTIAASDTFVDSKWGHESDSWYLYWHEDGVLLFLESFNEHPNMIKIYFNWKKTTGTWWDHFGVLGSGGVKEDGTEEKVAVFGKDVREGLRVFLEYLREHGEFVTPWFQRPFLWLVHHGEDLDYKEANRLKLAQLPPEILSQI